jgi:hypothetical protein
MYLNEVSVDKKDDQLDEESIDVLDFLYKQDMQQNYHILDRQNKIRFYYQVKQSINHKNQSNFRDNFDYKISAKFKSLRIK